MIGWLTRLLCGTCEDDAYARIAALEERTSEDGRKLRLLNAEIDDWVAMLGKTRKSHVDLEQKVGEIAIEVRRNERSAHGTAQDLLNKSIHAQHAAQQTLAARQKVQEQELNRLYDWAGRLHDYLKERDGKMYLDKNHFRLMEVDGT